MIQLTSGNTQPKLPLVRGVKCTANLRIPLLFMVEVSSSGSTKFGNYIFNFARFVENPILNIGSLR